MMELGTVGALQLSPEFELWYGHDTHSRSGFIVTDPVFHKGKIIYFNGEWKLECTQPGIGGFIPLRFLTPLEHYEKMEAV